MTNLTVVVSTTAQKFPFSIVPGQYTFTLNDAGNEVVAVQSSDSLTMTFADVAPGEYTVRVQRADADGALLGNGKVSDVISIPHPDVSIDVPDTVTVTMS